MRADGCVLVSVYARVVRMAYWEFDLKNYSRSITEDCAVIAWQNVCETNNYFIEMHLVGKVRTAKLCEMLFLSWNRWGFDVEDFYLNFEIDTIELRMVNVMCAHQTARSIWFDTSLAWLNSFDTCIWKFNLTHRQRQRQLHRIKMLANSEQRAKRHLKQYGKWIPANQRNIFPKRKALQMAAYELPDPSYRVSYINNNFQVQNMSYVKSYCYNLSIEHWTNLKLSRPA